MKRAMDYRPWTIDSLKKQDYVQHKSRTKKEQRG